MLLFLHTINFNPSIVYVEDNLYLVSIRAFRRGNIFKIQDITPSMYNPDHLWFGGYGSKTFWNVGEDGFGGTIFIVINITGRDISTKYKLDGYSQGTDMRLSNLMGQAFFIANIFFKRRYS